LIVPPDSKSHIPAPISKTTINAAASRATGTLPILPSRIGEMQRAREAGGPVAPAGKASLYLGGLDRRERRGANSGS
jgi:hypothetical protein